MPVGPIIAEAVAVGLEGGAASVAASDPTASDLGALGAAARRQAETAARAALLAPGHRLALRGLMAGASASATAAAIGTSRAVVERALGRVIAAAAATGEPVGDQVTLALWVAEQRSLPGDLMPPRECAISLARARRLSPRLRAMVRLLAEGVSPVGQRATLQISEATCKGYRRDLSRIAFPELRASRTRVTGPRLALWCRAAVLAGHLNDPSPEDAG